MQTVRTIARAAVSAIILAGPAAAAGIEDMTGAEREAFRAEVRAYLLDNPGVLMEAIAVLEERQAALAAASDRQLVAENRAALTDEATSWIGGNPDGDVTVIEFLDYRCGYCKRAHPEVTELIESDGDIRFIVKEFPILGEQSLMASRFALAVRAVEGHAAYARVNDALMTMRGEATPGSLGALARKQGLDEDAVMAAMDDPEIDRIIAANLELGQALGISGTPTFVFGDEMVRGYVPLDDMRQIVEEERG